MELASVIVKSVFAFVKHICQSAPAGVPPQRHIRDFLAVVVAALLRIQRLTVFLALTQTVKLAERRNVVMELSARIGGIYDLRQNIRNRRELRLSVNLDVCLSAGDVFDFVAAVIHCPLVAVKLRLQRLRASVIRVQHEKLHILAVRKALINRCSAAPVLLHIQLAEIVLFGKCVQYRTVFR